ncbi:unnamed protein product [Cyprideis torosa]|uniref:Uncharacterized protein n=1 Tax=Cyprideis torosa TaxID=163714 RepID=A0A7R8WLH7_9CRUS|nr:unnamed protein product [Cyprideis torosa]CAG0904360.1 unnamed protein product [Cyprideis torosa]
MAERPPTMSYPVEWFTSEIPDLFVCALCLGVVDQPVEVQPCLHMFCKTCIEDWTQVDTTCPKCRKPITANAFEEPGTNLLRLLNQLKIKCPDCSRQTEYSEFQRHRELCRTETTPCDKGCGLPLVHSEKAGHNCLGKSKEKIGQLEDKVRELEAELERQREVREDLERDVEERNEEIRKKDAEIEELRNALSSENSQANELRQKLFEVKDAVSSQFESVNAAIGGFTETLARISSERSVGPLNPKNVYEPWTFRFTLPKKDVRERNFPSRKTGDWEFTLRMSHHLFLCISYHGPANPNDAYSMSYEVTVNAPKWTAPFTYRQSEYFDQARKANHSFLLDDIDLSAINDKYNDNEEFSFEMNILSISRTSVRPRLEERAGVLSASFASVADLKCIDCLYSDPLFLRGGKKAQVFVRRWGQSLGVSLQVLQDPAEEGWSCRLKRTVTLHRRPGTGEALTKTETSTFNAESTYYWVWPAFLPWKDLTNASQGWLCNGALSLTASLEMLD